MRCQRPFYTIGPDPLAAVERYLRNLLNLVVNDSDTRQTFHIMMLECEYVAVTVHPGAKAVGSAESKSVHLHFR